MKKNQWAFVVKAICFRAQLEIFATLLLKIPAL